MGCKLKLNPMDPLQENGLYELTRLFLLNTYISSGRLSTIILLYFRHPILLSGSLSRKSSCAFKFNDVVYRL